MTWLLLTLALAAPLGPRELLEAGKRQLAQHKEVEARVTLERAKVLAADQPLLLAQVYLVLGRAFAESADEKHATEAFATALKLDRTLQLPAESPPKVLEWWSKAGGASPHAVEPVPTPAPSPEPEPAPPTATAPPQTRTAEPPAPSRAVEPPPPVQPAAVDTAARERTHWWLVPAGAAVVGMGLGVVFVNQSGGLYGQLTTASHLSMQDGASITSQGEAFQSAGWSLVGVAAAAVVAALVVLLLIDR